MKNNLEHFSEIMEQKLTPEVRELGQQSDKLYAKLTLDLSKDCCSDEIQDIVQEIVDFIQEHATTVSLDRSYWDAFIHSYSSDYVKSITDKKYGEGASDYIVKAFQNYLKNHFSG